MLRVNYNGRSYEELGELLRDIPYHHNLALDALKEAGQVGADELLRICNKLDAVSGHVNTDNEFSNYFVGGNSILLLRKGDDDQHGYVNGLYRVSFDPPIGVVHNRPIRDDEEESHLRPDFPFVLPTLHPKTPAVVMKAAGRSLYIEKIPHIKVGLSERELAALNNFAMFECGFNIRAKENDVGCYNGRPVVFDGDFLVFNQNKFDNFMGLLRVEKEKLFDQKMAVYMQGHESQRSGCVQQTNPF